MLGCSAFTHTHRIATCASTTTQFTPGNTRLSLTEGDDHARTTVLASTGPKLEPFKKMTAPPAVLAPDAPGPLRLLMTGGAYDRASALALLAPPSTVTVKV